MRRHISRNSFLEDILQQTRNRFQQLTRECESNVRQALADQFHDLKETLDIIRTDNAAADGEQDPEFRDRVQVTVQRSKERLEIVRQLIEG